MVGKSFGSYEILEALGEGGMGEVYRARDTKLERDVAIKVLPGAFAADPERLARFDREARLLAALNHRHIATIHGVEEHDGTVGLVMELVEGPTLAEHLAADGIAADGITGDGIGADGVGPEEALRIALQIADALEFAHEHGIVHRDLKPANVKLRRESGEWVVKILDFGLAKATETGSEPGPAADSPTLSLAATRAGVILGTAAYMSPEQAKGQPTDRRADIWSFGVVLWEMLSGERLFGGDSPSEVLASVIKEEPDWERLPDDSPPPVRHLLERCLVKEPRQRLQAIGEARILLQRTLDGRASEEPMVTGGTGAGDEDRGAPTRVHVGWVAAAVAVALAATVLAVVGFRSPGPGAADEGELRKLPLTLAGLRPDPPALSPDGRRIAYADDSGLWVRDLRQLGARRLVEDASARMPFWSYDNRWVGYFSDAGGDPTLQRVAATGGESVTITTLAQPLVPGAGATWHEGGIVYSAGNTPLYEVPWRGGRSRALVEPEGDEEHFHRPVHLPGGALVFPVHGPRGTDTIALYRDGSKRDLLQVDTGGVHGLAYSATGHLLFHRNAPTAGVWAVSLDEAQGRAVGEPFLVAPDGHAPAAGARGLLLYLRGGSGPPLSRLVRVDREGELLGGVGQPRRELRSPRLSPDGTRVAFTAAHSIPAGAFDIWVHDLERDVPVRKTFLDGLVFDPSWFPDGERIAFNHGDGPSVDVRVVGPGDAEPRPLIEGWDPLVSPGGEYLVFVRPAGDGGFDREEVDIWYAELDDGPGTVTAQDPMPFVTAPGAQGWGSFSPEGGYLAYQSTESGRRQVFIESFPAGGDRRPVARGWGGKPRWAENGRLYFLSGDLEEDEIWVSEVEVETEPELTIGEPRRLFRLPEATVAQWDVGSQGEEFFLVRTVEEGPTAPRTLVLVENWISEFR